MFTISLGSGKTYKVAFLYDYNVVSNQPTRHPTVTHCIIKNLANEKIIKGSAFCAPCDQFSKALGRKIALRRALCWFDNKFDRSMFWQAYWESLSQS